MRSALMTLRSTLINSLGCEPACTSVAANFDVNSTSVFEGNALTFLNQTTNATEYVWQVNNETFNEENLTYQFNERGFYTVCLKASNNNCINRKCVKIKVFGPEPCFLPATECNLLSNGNFLESNFIYGNNFIAAPFRNLSFNKICNWKNKVGDPDIYSKNGVVAAVINGSGGNTEGLVSQNKIFFKKNRVYNIIVDYLVTHPIANPGVPYPAIISTLDIGLCPNSDSYLDPTSDTVIHRIPAGNLFQMTYEELKVYNFLESDFVQESFNFLPTEDMSMHLFLINKIAVDNYYESNWLVKSIKVLCQENSCTTNPDFTFDELCPKVFRGSNIDGDGDQYTWNFLCNGVSMSGQNVIVDLPTGPCEVCLTIACDQETAATNCKTVNTPATSNECPSACQSLTVHLQTCEQDTSQNNSFIANFSITVPDGTGSCKDVGVISGSQLMNIQLSSYRINDDPNDVTKDIIKFGIKVVTPVGFDLLNQDVSGYLNLCDSIGNVICYNLIFSGKACEKCLGEVTATAACADTNPLDDNYSYSGNVIINLPPGFVFAECSSESTEVGYGQNVTFNPNNSTATVNFTINTTKKGDFDVSTLLCIKIDGVSHCFTLIIDIQPCPPIPDNCIDWGTKVTSATNCNVSDRAVTYNVTMNDVWLFSSEYSVCGNDLLLH
ncbi:MAG: hypothetical protein IPM26_00555 [Saprospiraceae bacterium]|nr:hypothetical protein [Saprospiraceae bacterium]